MEHICYYRKGDKEGGISELHKKGVGIFIAVADGEPKPCATLKAAEKWLQKQGYEPVDEEHEKHECGFEL